MMTRSTEPARSGVPPRPRSNAETLELDLLRRSATGDRAAFQDLFEHTGWLVLSLAKRLLRDADEAEDLLVEVFQLAWERAAQHDAERGSVRTWLLILTRFRGLDRLRQRQSRARREEVRPPEASLFLERADDDGGPGERASQGERNARVRAALATLPAQQRRLVSRAFFDGKSHHELAASEGLPLGTVKSQIRRGLAKLGRTLQGLEEQQ